MDVAQDFIENHTFEEIRIGDGASLERTLTPADIQLFAVMSGDVNPPHVGPDYARASRFPEVVAHGMWGGSLISTVLATQYPGPGTVYIDQTLHFSRPVTVGDTITVTVAVKEKLERTRHVLLDCRCVNQEGRVVIRGTAEVLAPAEKVRRPRAHLPEVRLAETGAVHRAVIARAKTCAPLAVAVAWPAHREALAGVVAAAQEGLVQPVLVGVREHILVAAAELGADVSSYEVVDAATEHEAAARAVELARTGRVGALVKGSLHVQTFMGAVMAAGTGLRSTRRMSHVALLDLPSLGRPLLVTDSLVNVAPTLEQKLAIVQNAIDVALALGIEAPKVALLAAVDSVHPKMPATIDAASLCKMAERGQIVGGVLDGPLVLDEAVSRDAAKAHGLTSAVAGCADVLVAPDMEAATMLVSQLEWLASPGAAGIIAGARVPIVVASRGEATDARVASCAMALLTAWQTRGLPAIS